MAKMKLRYTIPALLGLMVLLLVGSAFAADNTTTAAFVQASQLQLNIQKAVTVGTQAIATINAKSNGSDTTNLSATLSALTALSTTIDPSTATLDQVQSVRQQAEALVKSFRQQAGPMLSQSDKDSIKADAVAKFEAEHKDREDAVKQLRQAFNTRNLDSFAEAQQRLALGLSTSDNVSVVPELRAKLDDIRMKIQNDMVSKDQIGQIRTQIKAETESLKANRSATVADVRVGQLQQRVQALEIVIAKATAANISTDALQTSHDSLVALLSSYTSGNITADVFATQSHDAIEASTKLLLDSSLNSIRADVMRTLTPMRVQLRNQTMQDLQNWKDQRGQMMNDIKEMHGNISTLRLGMRDNITQARGELRTVINATRRGGPGMMGGLRPRPTGDGDNKGDNVNVDANASAAVTI